MIDYEYADLFLKDGIDKQIIINYDEMNITNERIYYEQLSITESICSESELRFGGCEASVLKFKIASGVSSLKDKVLTVSLVLNRDYTKPFRIGTYKVYSDKLTADKKYRDIQAYDMMYTLNNTEISEWYNGLIFPMTLKRFRGLLFEELNFPQQEIELPNDDAVLYATPYANKLFAGDLLKDICEINGCFGRINRDNIFEYKFLNLETEYVVDRNLYSRGALQYEDYKTMPIGGLILTQNSSDTKISYVIEENPYIMQTRVLYFGENSTALNTIGSTFYGTVYKIQYVPYSINCVGNYCAEVGDNIALNDGENIINSYIFERTISGIQNLKDSYSAEGAVSYENNQDYSNSSTQALRNEISAIEKNNFTSYSFTNAEEYTITEKDTTIIQFNISATAKTDVVLIATIPVYMNMDGEIVLNYTIDAATLKNEEIRQYLKKGYSIVTISNFIPMGENSRLTLGINASTAYFKSVEREHTVKIVAIENYIESGIYPILSVDETIPTAKIAKEAIKATLFAKGLAMGKEWDGTINVAEEYTPISYNNIAKLVNMSDVANVELQNPDVSSMSDTYTPFIINNAIQIVNLNDNILMSRILKFVDVLPRLSSDFEYSSEYVKFRTIINLEYGWWLKTQYNYLSHYVPNQVEIPSQFVHVLTVKTDGFSEIRSVEFTAPGEITEKLKMLIRVNGTLYTVKNGYLEQIEETTLTIALFEEYGTNIFPEWDMIKEFNNPEILSFGGTEMLQIYADMNAIPLPQTVKNKVQSFENMGVYGFESVEIEYEGNPLFCCSFDGGNTWYYYNNQWLVATSEVKGMTADAFIAVTSEQWQEVFSENAEFQVKFVLSTTDDIVRSIKINNIN